MDAESGSDVYFIDWVEAAQNMSHAGLGVLVILDGEDFVVRVDKNDLAFGIGTGV
jgi:hypothetical protein